MKLFLREATRRAHLAARRPRFALSVTLAACFYNKHEFGAIVCQLCHMGDLSSEKVCSRMLVSNASAFKQRDRFDPPKCEPRASRLAVLYQGELCRLLLKCPVLLLYSV